jgi:uncharacterized membrane protein YhaH (DUF805 family)
MNSPAGGPVDKAVSGDAQPARAAAGRTRGDVVRGLLNLLLVFGGFFLGPLSLVFYFAIQIWAARCSLFSFAGRLPRALFWVWTFAQAMYGGIAWGIIQGATEDEGASSAVYWSLIGVLVVLPTTLSVAAVGVKRLHDRNMPGWWLVLLYAAPIALIGTSALQGVPSFVHAVLPIPLFIGAFVMLGCLRGTVGANPFGPEIIAKRPKRAAA